jgi:hypothetical protein
MPTDGEQDFQLRLAPEASLIMTARLFASGLARLSGCSDERVEDVKLAVSEACAFVLNVGGSANALTVDAHRDDRRLTFHVGPAPDARVGDREDEAAALPQGLDLIRLVFDDARVTSAPRRAEPVVSFSVALGEPASG